MFLELLGQGRGFGFTALGGGGRGRILGFWGAGCGFEIGLPGSKGGLGHRAYPDFIYLQFSNVALALVRARILYKQGLGLGAGRVGVEG